MCDVIIEPIAVGSAVTSHYIGTIFLIFTDYCIYRYCYDTHAMILMCIRSTGSRLEALEVDQK